MEPKLSDLIEKGSKEILHCRARSVILDGEKLLAGCAITMALVGHFGLEEIATLAKENNFPLEPLIWKLEQINPRFDRSLVYWLLDANDIMRYTPREIINQLRSRDL